MGCGPAALWCDNLERVPNHWDVVLTDLSIGMLRDTQSALADARSRFQLAAADAGRLPFADASFETCIANHMLYHVADVAAVVAELHRVLVRGGTLLASTVGQAHMAELFQVARDISPAAAAVKAPRIGAFALEGGEALLRRWFAHVERESYANDLVVTSVDPLMEYLLSTATGDALSAGERKLCAEKYRRILASAGELRVTSETGLFIATRD